jgi:hypothetical protein
MVKSMIKMIQKTKKSNQNNVNSNVGLMTLMETLLSHSQIAAVKMMIERHLNIQTVPLTFNIQSLQKDHPYIELTT